MKVHQFSLVCWIAGSLVGVATAVVSADDSEKSLRLKSLDELVKLTELAREQEEGADSEAVQVTLKKITDLSTDLSRQTVGPAGRNLLTNGGFEEGTDGPSSWEKGQENPLVTLDWDRKASRSGTSSLMIDKRGNKYWPTTEWSQTVECAPDQKSLKVTAQVKTEKATKAVIDVEFLNADHQVISHEWACFIGMKSPKDKHTSHDWKEYTGKVKIPPKTRSMQINLQMYGPGKIWFDDVNAEYVD